MSAHRNIPDFALLGETQAFPDIVHFEHFRDRASDLDWVIPPHRHNAMVQLFYIDAGRASLELDGEGDEFNAGDFLFVPAGTVHAFALERGLDGGVLSFPLPILRTISPESPEVFARLSRPFTGRMGPALNTLIAQFQQVFRSTSPLRAQILTGISIALLARVAEAAGGVASGIPTNAARKSQHFEALLAAHLLDGWSARDYASALNITTGQLSRLCRAASGQPASVLIERAVMTEASRLLAFTQLPVAEIGYRLRYGDPAYFSRRFKAALGETPSAYRARFLSV